MTSATALDPDSTSDSVNFTSPTVTPSLFSLSNQTIVITGAGRGLGLTLATAAVESGAHVACLDTLNHPTPDEWAQLKRLASTSNLTVSYHQCNIIDEASLSLALDEIAKSACGRGTPFSGIVACAGIQQKAAALDYSAADFEHLLRVNVLGTFLTARCAARIFVKEKTPGSIVLVASMSGHVANRGFTSSAYNSSKSAVHQMCRSVAQEWGPYGIRVNTLSPGYIRTAMTDLLLENEPDLEKTWMAGALLGRLGTPEDFKAPTIFLLASGSSFITGADLRVDGGNCASA